MGDIANLQTIINTTVRTVNANQRKVGSITAITGTVAGMGKSGITLRGWAVKIEGDLGQRQESHAPRDVVNLVQESVTKQMLGKNAVVLISLSYLCGFGLGKSPAAFGQTAGKIEIDFRDESSGELVPCRVRILDQRGRPQRGRGVLFQAGWNLVEETLLFKGRAGDYTYRVEHGPQFSAASGGFTLDRQSASLDVIHLPRHADLHSEGWFGGDLLSRVNVADTLRWLPAEDLSMAVRVRTAEDLKLSKTEELQSVDMLGAGEVANRQSLMGKGAPRKKVTGQKLTKQWVEAGGYWDNRPGSGLVLHHWLPPAPVPAHVPSTQLLGMAKPSPNRARSGGLADSLSQSSASEGKQPADDRQGSRVHAEIQRLWARDAPLWLASDRIDSIQILSNHLTRDGSQAAPVQPIADFAELRRQRRSSDDQSESREAGPRRASSLKKARVLRGQEAGRLVEYLYWQVLEAGLRIPPSAGSGFGSNASPLGYNRVYVSSQVHGASQDRMADYPWHTVQSSERQVEPPLSPSAWWQALRNGRSFVTNGPLLRATVNGRRPGHVFQLNERQPLSVQVGVQLTVSDPVEYLDVIFNGQSLYRARLDEYARQGGKIPPLSIEESGWMVVRVVTEVTETYRFATTAPFYFEVAGKPRVSRQAVELFQAWLAEAKREIAELSQPAPRAARPYIAWAERFWQERLQAATVP